MSLTINTNMTGIMTQHFLTKSTNALNDAIQKMTTGYKINSAKDDAAGYAIAKKMEVELSSYEVAQQNTMMATSLISTATNSMDILTTHLQRIRDLSEQAANGTYDDNSRQAIQTEINQRIEEINRIMATTEYNGIKLFSSQPSSQRGPVASKGPNGKFINDIVTVTPDVIVTDPTQLASAISNNSKIGISNAQTLAKLAELVNSGTNCSGKTIILTEDIDLSGYSSGTGWTPIGKSWEYYFQGNFDGQGHVVKNLYINNPTADYQGLFGVTDNELKNVGIENCNVTGRDYTGGLAGRAKAITNCYATGNVTGRNDTGGLAGYSNYNTTSCYATGNVTGGNNTGGLVGYVHATSINCYATGNVTGGGNYTGGLVGYARNSVIGSYATGDVTGRDFTGGLAGYVVNYANKSFATGNVSGGNYTGGLVGYVDNYVDESFATGDVMGQTNTGGLVGNARNNVIESYATGNVTGGDYTGGLVGQLDSVIDSYATGDVTGKYSTGGLVGKFYSAITSSTSYAKNVSGTSDVGSFVGRVSNSDSTITDSKCIEISGLDKIGPTGTEAQKAGITYTKPLTERTFQVGIDSSENSCISVDTGLNLGNISINVKTTDSARSALDTIDEALSKITKKQTELGSVQNRLDSVLKSINVSMDNLTSSISTIKDADIAKVSAEYVQQQILQQASATLLATANQAPSVALQLI